MPEGGQQGLLGSRTTHCPFALFFDHGRTDHARPSRRVGMAPAMTTTKAPTRSQLSRLNRTASGLAVYASSRALPHATQNSLPAAGQALPDGIGYPQGCYERFLMLLILPSRAFLAQGHAVCPQTPLDPRGDIPGVAQEPDAVPRAQGQAAGIDGQ